MSWSASDPWSQDALALTVTTYFGVGSDVGAPDEVRFLRSVTGLARKRFAAGKEEPSDAPVIFLLHPTEPPEIAERSRREVPMLDSGIEMVGGRIWFVNHLANDGIGIELRKDDDDAGIFRLLRQELGVGGVPAVVIETREGLFEARFYPDGLSRSDTCQVIPLKQEPVTLVQIRHALDIVYNNDLCTPDAQKLSSVWAKASAHWAKSDAEQRIQHILKVGLQMAFPHCVILPEQPGNSGRLDLLVQEPDLLDRSVVTLHAILELKVLRERGETGSTYTAAEINESIRKGIGQAASYRNERGARLAALACYDMRATYVGEDAFIDYQDLASQHSVATWLWHLFGSSEAYRTHHMTASLD